MRSLDLTQLHQIRLKQVMNQLNQNSNQQNLLNSQQQEHVLSGEESDNDMREERSHQSNEVSELDTVKRQTSIEVERSNLNKQRNRNSHIELQIANEQRKAAEANQRAAQANAKAISSEAQAQKERVDGIWNSRLDRLLRWLKLAFLLVLLLTVTLACVLGLYYLYRVVTEEPIIKTVTETVTETVEKEVIPEECTQVRRNGKVYVSCDGVTVQGAPTIADSGLDEIPELISE